MKTKFLKMILPMAVIAFAIFGAFNSQAMDQKKSTSALANETGWYHVLSTDPCISSTMCSTAPGPVCTVNAIPGNQQLYRKGTGATNCGFELKQPQP